MQHKTWKVGLPQNNWANYVDSSYMRCGMSELQGWCEEWDLSVWLMSLIKSRLWRACHKSRESDTWWEVSEMILACNLQLPKIDPWNKWCLCMLPWEKQPMNESMFSSASKGTNQLSCSCKKLLNCWEKMCIYGWDLGWLLRGFA